MARFFHCQQTWLFFVSRFLLSADFYCQQFCFLSVDMPSSNRMVVTKTLTTYKCILASFTSAFVYNCPIGSKCTRHDHVHARIEVLGAISTPNDVLWLVCIWIWRCCLGQVCANPILACTTLVATDKNAFPSFMPNCNVWSVTRTEGNPILLSALVNALVIKWVKKKEARKQRVDLQTQYPMLGQEFIVMHDLSLKNHSVLNAGRRSNKEQGATMHMMRFEKGLVYQQWWTFNSIW